MASSVTTITVTISGETSGFTSEGQTLNLIRHLWRPIKPAENALLELRLKAWLGPSPDQRPDCARALRELPRPRRIRGRHQPPHDRQSDEAGRSPGHTRRHHRRGQAGCPERAAEQDLSADEGRNLDNWPNLDEGPPLRNRSNLDNCPSLKPVQAAKPTLNLYRAEHLVGIHAFDDEFDEIYNREYSVTRKTKPFSSRTTRSTTTTRTTTTRNARSLPTPIAAQ